MKKRFSYKLPQVNLARRFNLQPKSATYLIIGLFFLIGGVYFVVVNVVSNKGTELRLLEVSNKGMEAENQRLEVEAARLKSLQVIDEGASRKVEVGDPDKTTTNTTTNTTTGVTTQGETQKLIVVVPKLVPSKQYTYLPSYSALAQR